MSVAGGPSRSVADPFFHSSQRGVVFFRDATITPDEQKTLIEALGQAGGKPAGHGLHVHPLTAETSEFGKEISVISSEYTFAQKFGREKEPVYNKHSGRHEWVSISHCSVICLN